MVSVLKLFKIFYFNVKETHLFTFDRPLWTCLVIFFYISVVFVPLFALLRIRKKRDFFSNLIKGRGWVLPPALSIVAISGYFALVIWYITNGNILHHIESQIASVSWLFIRGEPVYHEIGSAEQYTLIYGPALYIINGIFLKLFGPSISSAKLAGALSGMLSLIVIFLTLRKITSNGIALMFAGFVSLALLLFEFQTFMIRPDSLLLFCVAIGLFGAVRGSKVTAVLLAAAATGIAFNIKVHAPIYFLPIYVHIYSRFGFRSFILCACGALATAAAPFIVFPQISATNYFLWLRQISGQGLDTIYLRINLVWLMLFFVPPAGVLLYRRGSIGVLRENFLNYFAIVVSALVVTIVASKPGAGPHHYVPLLPILSYMTARALEDKKKSAPTPAKRGTIISTLFLSLAATLSFVVMCYSIGMYHSAYSKLNGLSGRDVVNDIQRIVRYLPNMTVGMGLSLPGDYRLTNYRPDLVYAGNPYLFDGASLYDARRSGVELSAKSTEAIEACQVEVWLIPKGGRPFYYVGGYADYENVPVKRDFFSRELRLTFQKRYGFLMRTKYFDVWVCRDQ